MKISKIIIPEIVLGRRGPEEILRMYREVMGSLKVQLGDNGGFEAPGIAVPTQMMKMLDSNLIHHFWMAKQFKEMNAKVYYVPKDFAQALSEIDRPLPAEYFPYMFFGWVQFASGALSDEEIVLGSVHKFSVELRKETLEELSAGLPNTDYFAKGQPRISVASEEIQKKRNKVTQALINAALYISSSEPELMKLRPLEEMTHSKRVEYKKTHPVDNLCTVPITLVNWPYEGKRQRHVDSSFVQAHLRWRPCGMGKLEHKWIWVKEHERQYKKEEPSEVKI